MIPGINMCHIRGCVYILYYKAGQRAVAFSPSNNVSCVACKYLDSNVLTPAHWIWNEPLGLSADFQVKGFLGFTSILGEQYRNCSLLDVDINTLKTWNLTVIVSFKKLEYWNSEPKQNSPSNCAHYTSGVACCSPNYILPCLLFPHWKLLTWFGATFHFRASYCILSVLLKCLHDHLGCFYQRAPPPWHQSRYMLMPGVKGAIMLIMVLHCSYWTKHLLHLASRGEETKLYI